MRLSMCAFIHLLSFNMGPERWKPDGGGVNIYFHPCCTDLSVQPVFNGLISKYQYCYNELLIALY